MGGLKSGKRPIRATFLKIPKFGAPAQLSGLLSLPLGGRKQKILILLFGTKKFPPEGVILLDLGNHMKSQSWNDKQVEVAQLPVGMSRCAVPSILVVRFS
jgi:hypothetical protein